MNKMLSKMEIVTDNLSGESTDNPLKSEDIISRLEAVFAHIYEKDSSFASMISETGELLIEDICKAPSVIEITADINTIKTAIFGSKVLRVISDIKVKSATAKPDQNTLILRDIATSTDSNEILKLFSNTISSDGSPCPVVQSIRSDMNDTWFVTFHSETDAKKALFSIREAKFEGKPIRVRLKTESTVKSFYSGTTRDPQSQQQTAGNRPDRDGFSSSPKENMNNNNSTLRSVSYSPSAVPTTPFFGAYPVPPPMQQHHPSVPGQQSQAGGPPSAYATMVLGPDGKPLYPGMPDTAAAAMASSQQVQLMLAAQQQHQQAYMDMLHNQQQQQQQQHRHGGYGGYNNNRYRYGRNQNSGYNSNQNMNGGYAQRSPNYRNNRTTGPRSYFAGNNNQQSHQMPPPAVATTATSGVGVNISETATAENEETSNSTAGSSSNSNTESAAATTTVERSSPDTATAVPGTEGQQGPGAAASDTTNNPPTGPSSTTSKRFAPPSNAMRPQGAPPMMGMGGPQLPPHMANQGFMNFMPPGAAQHFFPNYPYPGIPFNYNPGLAPNGPGMIPHMGQMGPGAFPPPMGMGYYPGHPPGHVGGGYRHRNTGQLPRRASEGDVRAGTQQQYKGTTQPPEFNQNGAVMHRTAANRSVTSGSLESDTSAALPPPPANTPAALSLEERKVHNNQTTSNSYNNSNSSNTNNNYKNYRDKKILSATTATETTAGGEKNTHEKRNNSRKTSTENTTTGSKYSGSSTVETGGEQLSNISTGDNSSNKNIVRKYHSNANTTNNTTTINNTTEKKKMNNRDKDNKTRTANIGKTEASVNVKPSAEFNMESDFPTLMVMDSAEKSSDTATSTTTSTSTMPLKTVFDYATAARKASSHIESSTVSAAAVAAVASSPASSSSTNPAAAVSVEAPKDSSKAASGRKTERDDAVAMKGVAQRQQLEQPCGTSPASPVVHSKPLKGGAKHLEVASIGEHVPAATTVRTTTNNESSVGVESFTFGSVVAPVVESAERQVFHFGSHGKPVGAKAPVVAVVEKQQKEQTDSIAAVPSAGPAVSGVSTGNPVKATTAGGPSVPPSSAAAVVAKPTPAASVSSKKSEPATSVVMPAAAPMIDRSAWPVPSSSRTVPVPSNPSPSLMASSRSSNSTATSSTPPVVENSTATAAGSAWGSKKSFLDVVRPHEKA